MIRWKVKELAQQRGFKTAYQLALEAKLPINTVTPIWNGTAKGAMFKTMQKLSVALEVSSTALFEEFEPGNSATLIPAM